MKELLIHASSLTPRVHFKPDGDLSIDGRSIPVNAIKMYKQMFLWTKELLDSPPPSIVLKIKYEYCDSASLKNIFELIKMIHSMVPKKGFQFRVEWHYEADDNEIFDQGEYLQQHVKVQFDLVCVE